MAQYTFNGSEGSPIDLATAKEWVANYRNANPGQVEAHFFGFEIIQKILAEQGSMGIRIYYGIDGEGKKQLILIGADTDGNNLLPSANDNTIADASLPCPQYCPPNSATSL